MRPSRRLCLSAFCGALLACSGAAPSLSPGGSADAGSFHDAQPDVGTTPQQDSGTSTPAADSGAQPDSSSTTPTEAGATCNGGLHTCGGVCVPEGPGSCGPSCAACTAPTNATATCAASACGFTCNSGYAVCGTSCCQPYDHTITIDGTNDFTTATEQVTTTSSSSGYYTYVTWDSTNLYLGFEGSDIAAGATAGQTFLFAYVDKDPGASNGATTGQEYGTQTPKFPGGFNADWVIIWNPDTLSLTLSEYLGAQWVPQSATPVNLMRGSSDFVELSVPLATLGISSGGKLGLASMMMYTHAAAEWSYAGIWTGSFTDGYYGMVPISYFFEGELSSASAPNAMSDRQF